MNKETLAPAVALVAALLGLTSGLMGAWIGSRATIVSQREQLQDARAERTRKQRVSVYAGFLDATEAYANPSFEMAAECGSTFDRRKGKCTIKSTAAYGRARPVFQGALNDVYVYGSVNGVAAAREIAGTLPPSLQPDDGEFKFRVATKAEYRTAYKALLQVMCLEASAAPRANC